MPTRRGSTTPLTPDSNLLAGRYALGAEIGRGGASIVYRAADRRTGADVAVKMLRRELVGAVTAARFLREVRVSGELRHPNIVPVLDSGMDEAGTPFYVMPLLVDGTLAERIARERALGFDLVLRVAGDVATALDYAHEHGVLHRDVKPQNILFDGNRAVVTDFGIARLIARLDEDTLTDSGVVLGTPLYMSPEQADGDREIDRRADVYSLGCLVFEMLAGEPPFNGPTTQSVIAKHRTERVPRLSVVRSNVADGVQAVLERALAKVPADRYATAGEMVRALSAALLMPAPARAVSRRRLVLAAGVAAAVVLSGVIARLIIGTPEPPAGAVLDPRHVAVLYFDNHTPERSAPYLAEALTESLIDELSRVEELHVISPPGVRPFRNRTMPVDSIARLLGVGTIIEGSTQQIGDSMSVAVRLIDAASGQQLYSETIREPAANALRLQDSVANDIAFALRERLGRVIAIRRFRPSTKSTPAWETAQIAAQTFRDALEARRQSATIEPADGLILRADALYARAESLDGQWPLPTLRRALLSRLVAEWGDSVAPPEGRPSTGSSARQQWAARALRLAATALSKGADSADVFEQRGAVALVLARSTPAGADSLLRSAERDLRAAVERKPRSAEAWTKLADLYLVEGRGDEALTASERAFDADAFVEFRSTISRGFQASLNLERIDRAREWCAYGFRRYPGDPEFRLCRLRILAAEAGAKHGDVDSAWSEVRRIEDAGQANSLPDTWGFNRAMVAAVAARGGLRDSAQHILASIRSHRRSDGLPALGKQEEAYVDLLLGDRDAAVDLLREQLREAPGARNAIANNPWFKALHGDPRFEAAVRPAR